MKRALAIGVVCLWPLSLWAAVPVGMPTVGPAIEQYGPQGRVDTYVDEACVDTGKFYLSLVTNVDADCKYSATVPDDFASMTDFSTDGGYCEDSDGSDDGGNILSDDDFIFCRSNADCRGACRRYVHWQELSGLPQGAHTYYVMCTDGTTVNDKTLAVSFTYDESSSDFDDRGAGKKLCLSFDYEGTLLDPDLDSYVIPDGDEHVATSNDQRCLTQDCEQIVFGSASTGSSGALRFEYPAGPGTKSTTGYFEHNFTPNSHRCGSPGPCPQSYPVTFGNNEEFWVQFRYRLSRPHMFLTQNGGDNSAKLIIVGEGDTANDWARSCSDSEAVTILEEFGGPHLYHSCGMAAAHNSFGGVGSTLTQADVPCCTDQSVPNGCNAGGGITSGDGSAAHRADACLDADKGGGPRDAACWGCPKFPVDQWFTYTQRFTIGTMQTQIANHTHDPGSRWQVWITPDGGSRTLVFDSASSYHGGWHWHQAAGRAFGKMWLLHQVSSKSAEEPHAQSFFYYDDLIISTVDPGDPGGAGNPVEPPLPPQALRVGS